MNARVIFTGNLNKNMHVNKYSIIFRFYVFNKFIINDSKGHDCVVEDFHFKGT